MNDDQDLNYPFPEPKASKNSSNADQDNPALRLIRQKIDKILDDEPSARQEVREVRSESGSLSKHQRFIAELTNSGKPLAEIQTAWHEYYVALPNKEKKQVWEEFYSAHKQAAALAKHSHSTSDESSKSELEKKPMLPITRESIEKKLKSRPKRPSSDLKSLSEIKNQIIGKVEARSIARKFKNGGKSLIFGLSLGFFVLVILLFGFFNDRFIAPFITPSRTVSAQSIILDPNSVSVGPNPIIIIPKINVEIPVVYNAPNINSDTIETYLEQGVVHYPTTPYPGQLGNGVIFGHSSNNILNPGMYKFAFVLLHDLQPGDTFMLEYNSKLYIYQIYKKSIVSPNDVSVLTTQDKPATFTLITCDPPGTSINRLVVVGEQISPDPTADVASSVNQNSQPKPSILPSNSPSLWSRLTSDL